MLVYVSCCHVSGLRVIKSFVLYCIVNGGGGILVYVRDYINAKRRGDLKTNDISCFWLQISPDKGKSFLVGNIYRPPDSKIEYNDRFEEFIDAVLNEDKEFILLGDINKNLLNNDIERECGYFITSLGLTQLVSEPTRVTNDSSTLMTIFIPIMKKIFEMLMLRN